MSHDRIPTEERVLCVFKELGIRRAHIAGRLPSDWAAFVAKHSDAVASFILMAPIALTPASLSTVAGKSLVVTGDDGPHAHGVLETTRQVEGAETAILPGFTNLSWLDVVADYRDEIGIAVSQFVDGVREVAEWESRPPKAGSGVVAGISYRIQGEGPPLVLLPLSLAPSQWEPLIPILSERYCTIVLGGAELGMVELLEARGRAPGYLRMLKTLVDEAQLRPAEKVLEVGCGTGVIGRWLSSETGGENPYMGLDINPYLLAEAGALLQSYDGPHQIEFKEGSGESLPFADDSFDVTVAITVIEEVDADKMLSELARVTRTGGRVAVIARAMDLPFYMHVPLPEDLKVKVEAPGVIGAVGAGGCADASLYLRFRNLPLRDLRVIPQIPVFDASEPSVINFMQGILLGKLTAEEGTAWQHAREKAEKDGSFFVTWPHHCAIGTKR